MLRKSVLKVTGALFILGGALLFSTGNVKADTTGVNTSNTVKTQKVERISSAKPSELHTNTDSQQSTTIDVSKEGGQTQKYTYNLQKVPSKAKLTKKITFKSKKGYVVKAANSRNYAKNRQSLKLKKISKKKAKSQSGKNVNKKGTVTKPASASVNQSPVSSSVGQTTADNNTTTTNTAPATSTNDANTGSSSTPSTSTGTTDSNQTSSNNTTSFNPQSTKISTGSNAVNGQQTQQSQQATQEAKDAQLDKEAQSANTRLQPWYTGTAAAANVGELAYYVTGSVSNVVGQGTAIVGAVTNVISTIRNLF
ncbi:hypothetical protein [Lentilactobacillus hilgardii]|uniref:hypothetical protein n=1 Tax=Lentilactobacillus hilgardii TaxID=1588 RepID=UPI0039E7EAD2